MNEGYNLLVVGRDVGLAVGTAVGVKLGLLLESKRDRAKNGRVRCRSSKNKEKLNSEVIPR